MKRWTILFVSHDTDEPRSVAVSARALRWMGFGAGVVAVAAIVGVGAIATWATQLGRGEDRALVVSDGEVRTSANAAAEMDSLRETVDALNSALDTIRREDARLSAAAGVPAPDSATLQAHAALKGSRAAADSLLRRASLVADRLGQMADSASARESSRRAPSPSPRPSHSRRDAAGQR